MTDLIVIEPLGNGKTKAPRALSIVRAAGVDDFEELAFFLLEMRNEIDDGQVEEDLLVDLARTLVNRQFGVVFIIRGWTGIEASLGILFERPRLARSYRLRSVWNVVTPAARNTTGHAKSLLVHARRFADNMERPLFLDACLPPHKIELDGKIEPSPKLRLCSRHLDAAGRIFAYVPGG